jgi:hypothetical protein
VTRGRAAVVVATVSFVLAFAVRVANAPAVFAGPVPSISVLDELYHFKRIAYTAANFPHVLERDPDRGEQGAYCPWPPLYDFAFSTVCRLLGATQPVDVLRVVVWLPPLLTALFVAAIGFTVAWRRGWESGAALALTLALTPALITHSSIGSIDQHFLEGPLALAILAAAILVIRELPYSHGLLATALVAALLVQTALIIAAGLAFLLLFLAASGRAGARSFAIAAAVIAIDRVLKPHDYPNSAWFLGWAHASLLAAAATALFVKPRVGRLVAAIAGALFVVPQLPLLAEGRGFFAGETWLRTIDEFQPLWRAHGADLLYFAVSLGAGVIMVWPLARRPTRLSDAGVALFAIVYLGLTITSRRFWMTAIPLLAVAATFYAARLTVRLRRACLIALVAPAVIHFAIVRRDPPRPVLAEREAPWIRAAAFLSRQTPGGRVLAPWSMGHTIDVIGGRPVMIDGFGTMPDKEAFDRAQGAFLAVNEDSLWRYCESVGVRYVVLENPLYGLPGAAITLGIAPQLYVPLDERGQPAGVTRLAASTWWWRAYYGGVSPARRFRLAYSDPQPSWRGTAAFRGPALLIWEIMASGP